MTLHRPAWQKRRSAFNHDWLKNRFLSALVKWSNLLDDRIEDPAFERFFVAGVLPQWEQHRAEAFALPSDFEAQMSPRILLGDRADSWLGSLVHQLWLNRYHVRECVDQAIARALGVEEAYRELRTRLCACPDMVSAVSLRPLRPEFDLFRDRCQQLARSLEMFLSEVTAT